MQQPPPRAGRMALPPSPWQLMDAPTWLAAALAVAATLTLAGRDSGLAMVVDTDLTAVLLAASAMLLAGSALRRRPAGAPWWGRALILAIAVLLSVLALGTKVGLTRQLPVQVPIAGQQHAAWLYAPRARGPFPGLVLAGDIPTREARFLGRFLAERGVVSIHLQERVPEELIEQAAMAVMQLLWLSEREEVGGRALGVMGKGGVVSLAAAVAPEVEFAVAVVHAGEPLAEVWSQVHTPILALAGGERPHDVVDALLDQLPVASALQAVALTFEGTDEALRRTPRALPWPALPQGFPQVIPVWIATQIDGIASSPEPRSAERSR